MVANTKGQGPPLGGMFLSVLKIMLQTGEMKAFQLLKYDMLKEYNRKNYVYIAKFKIV